jgi:ABC-type oligopeptide transport system substrate-binding subunit
VNLALRSQNYDLACVKRNDSNIGVANDFLTQNDGSENVTSYTNPEVDALLSLIDDPASLHTCDSTMLRDLYIAAEQEIAEDLPQIMLFAYEEPFALRDWVLTNTEFDYLLGPLMHIYMWQVYYGPQDQ